MLRQLLILTLLVIPFLGLTAPASAKMMLSPAITAPIVAPPISDMPPPGVGHRMPTIPYNLESNHSAQAHVQILTEATRDFWTYIAVLSIAFIVSGYLLGRGVIARGWRVGYTRKAQALGLYFLPYVAMQGPSPYSPIMTATLSLGVFIALLILLSSPIRKRVPMLATAFAAIDRPEDRPFTLTWLITSVLAAWGVIVLWLWLSPHTAGYLFVALVISGIGDALAEPVGLLFGKHPYKARALGTERNYIRTYEGSATVFFSGVIAVLMMHGFSMDAEALLALALFPVVGMLAEAKSPHTWDQPFIMASCALVAVAISPL